MAAVVAAHTSESMGKITAVQELFYHLGNNRPPETILPLIPLIIDLYFTINSLEEITEEDLRQYWLCCQSEFGWSAATLRISYSRISHFFKKTIVRSWDIFKEIKWKREETLPTILSIQEVRKIIYALPTLQSHTFYLILYSLGLRLREATTLQVRDILSDRGLVHIHARKAALDRMVPLPKITLETLRKYYRTHQNPKWIFPAMVEMAEKRQAS